MNFKINQFSFSIIFLMQFIDVEAEHSGAESEGEENDLDLVATGSDLDFICDHSESEPEPGLEEELPAESFYDELKRVLDPDLDANGKFSLVYAREPIIRFKWKSGARQSLLLLTFLNCINNFEEEFKIMENVHSISRDLPLAFLIEFKVPEDKYCANLFSYIKDQISKVFQSPDLSNAREVRFNRYSTGFKKNHFVRFYFPNIVLYRQTLRDFGQVLSNFLYGAMGSFDAHHNFFNCFRHVFSGHSLPGLCKVLINGTMTKIYPVSVTPQSFQQFFLIRPGSVEVTQFQPEFLAEVERMRIQNLHKETTGAPSFSGIFDMQNETLFDPAFVKGMYSVQAPQQFLKYMDTHFAKVVQGEAIIYWKTLSDDLKGQLRLVHTTQEKAIKAFKFLTEDIMITDESVRGKNKTRKVTINLLKVYLEHPDSRHYISSVFQPGFPTTIEYPGEQFGLTKPFYILNTALDFRYVYVMKHSYTPMQIVGMESCLNYPEYGIEDEFFGTPPDPFEDFNVDLYNILYHIWNVYCYDEDPEVQRILFWAFNSFFARILHDPKGEEKRPAFLLVVGPKGVGKTQFIKAIGKHVFGCRGAYLFFGGDSLRVVSRFNGFLDKSCLVHLDEARMSNVANLVGHILSLISDDLRQSEKKFGELEQVENRANFLATTSEASGFPMEVGDRRVWCFNCSPQFLNNEEYMKRYATLITEKSMFAYALFLKNAEQLRDKNIIDFFKGPIMTPLKKLAIIHHCPPIVRWWSDNLHKGSIRLSRRNTDATEELAFTDEGWPTVPINQSLIVDAYRADMHTNKETIELFGTFLKEMCIIEENKIKKTWAFPCIFTCQILFDYYLRHGEVHLSINLKNYFHRELATRRRTDPSFHTSCFACERLLIN